MKIKIKFFALSLLVLLIHLPLFSQVQIGENIPGELPYDRSGRSVSLSGNGTRVAIGADQNDENGNGAGHARIYEWDGINWIQMGEDIDGEAENNYFGNSVSLSSDGNRVAIGAYGYDVVSLQPGHTKIYEWDGTNWNQLGENIEGENSADESGGSVALSSDGSIVAIGAIRNNGGGSDAGHARIFQWNGTSWVQLGSDIDGDETNDHYGQRVSISADGQRIAVCATGDFFKLGYLRAFEFIGQDWVQMGNTIIGDSLGEIFASGIAMSGNGNRLAVGAHNSNENGNQSGVTKIFDWDGTNWIQIGNKILGDNPSDLLGGSVSLTPDGNRIAISARCVQSSNPEAFEGFARVYEWNGQVWNKLGGKIEAGAVCSVSISSDGETVAIGVPFNDEGYVGVYDLNDLSSLDETKKINFEVFPNPTNGILMITGIEYESIQILDNFGRLVLDEQKVLSQIDLSDFPNGIYFILIQSGDGYLVTRFIKQS
jgi:hypothetical protein